MATKRPVLGSTAVALAMALGTALTLAACSSGTPTAPTTSATSAPTSVAPTTTAPETTAPTTAAATPTLPGSVTASPTVPATTPTAPPSASSAPSSPAATPPATPAVAMCTAASLTGSIDDSGGGTAGSVYVQLIVKNTAATPCVLNGYPGVSMVDSSTGAPIGEPANWDYSRPSTGPITLAPGASAGAVLRYTEAGNYPNCKQTSAKGLRVYPPSATDTLYIAHPLMACDNTDIVLLTVGAFQP